MVYTRSNAEAYVQDEHEDLLTEAAIGHDDAQTGIKSVLDRAFRALDVAEAGLPAASVEDAQVGKLEALLDYYTFDRVVRKFIRHVNISKSTAGTSVTKSRAAVYDHAVAERERMATILSRRYDFEPDGNEVEVFDFNMDFLEPAE